MALYSCMGESFFSSEEKGALSRGADSILLSAACSWVKHLHSLRIYHRDLKPENLLLSKDQQHLKISDFGLAIRCTPESLHRPLTTMCGTPHFCAPDILRNAGYSGAAADVWSCGCILYVMLTGTLPFSNPNLPALFDRIIRGWYRPIPKHVSPLAQDLLRRILQPNPRSRATVPEILEHDWVRGPSPSTVLASSPLELPTYPTPLGALASAGLGFAPYARLGDSVA